MASPYDLYQVPDYFSQYFLGGGQGAGRFNQQYRPTIQQVLTRKNRPEITGMPGQPVYIDQMSNPQYVSRQGPDIFYQKQRSPLGANLYPNVGGMGDFTPSAGLMGGDIQPAVGDLSYAPSGSQYINQTLSDQYLRSATGEAPVEDIQQAAPQAAPQRTLGLLGDLFGGASAFDEYMTPEQKAQLQNQGLMSAAMQLLAASGPSRVPVGLGQALGQAYGAGQQGYTAAQQNLLQSMAMKQKMDEYKRARDIEAQISGALAGEGGAVAPGGTITAEQAINAPGGQVSPTVERAAMIGTQVPASAIAPKSATDIQYDRYMAASAIAARVGDTTKAKAYSDLAKQIRPTDEVIGEPFRGDDGNFYQRLKSGGTIPFKGASPMDKPIGEPFRADDGKYYQRTESGGIKLFGEGQVKPAAKPSGQPQQQLVDGKAQMVQYYDDGTYKVVSGIGQVAKPQGEPRMQMIGGVPKMVQYYDDGTSKVLEGVSQFNAPSTSITDVEYLTGKGLGGTGPAGVAKVQDYRRSGATSVSINTGEKGFKNEFDLKKEFTNEPIYKEFQSMKSAFSQVQESLKKENPIGDVAAATKIMKLLDPGSVVRESELGIAMAASGKMDRLTNYVDMWKKGTLLTPSQRNDFGSLANELYNASANAYNAKRGEYANFGAKYEIDANTALGANAPVFTFTPPASAGAAGRPPLSSIIRPRGAQ